MSIIYTPAVFFLDNVTFKKIAAGAANTSDPIIMPILSSKRICTADGWLSNAKEPTNMLIVKPIPHRTETPYRLPRLTPSSSLSTPNLIATQLKPNALSCIPGNRPAATQIETRCRKSSSPIPRNDNPCVKMRRWAKSQRLRRDEDSAPNPSADNAEAPKVNALE
jgi:hypothetical protein